MSVLSAFAARIWTREINAKSMYPRPMKHADNCVWDSLPSPVTIPTLGYGKASSETGAIFLQRKPPAAAHGEDVRFYRRQPCNLIILLALPVRVR